MINCVVAAVFPERNSHVERKRCMVFSLCRRIFTYYQYDKLKNIFLDDFLDNETRTPLALHIDLTDILTYYPNAE